MFGFLRVPGHELAYRQAYARCCSFQHLQFGIDSLPFLSYEAVFLYVLAWDAGFCSGPPARAATCCRLQASRRLFAAADADVAEFCAAFGLLLASIKLDDDVRDSGGVLARLVRWRLRRRLQRAKSYFETRDMKFTSAVDAFIQRHLQLERSVSPIPIEQYAEPTAEAFAHVFGLMAGGFSGKPHNQRRFEQIGADIGAAIVAYDCAIDWRRDRRYGHFNPLPDESAVANALEYSGRRLAQAGWTCVEAFGAHARTAPILRAACNRVSLCRRVTTQPVGWHARLERWGLRRQPGYVYARMCCCDCGSLDCAGDCCAGGGDAAANADMNQCGGGCCGPFACWAPCDCCWVVGGTDSRSSRKSEESARPGAGTPPNTGTNSRVGQSAVTATAVDPFGTVLIDGERKPARSLDRFLGADVSVIVVEETDFGLTVRAKNA